MTGRQPGRQPGCRQGKGFGSTLRDDSTRLAESAEAAGVEIRLDVFPEMQHIFQRFTGNMPEADEAIAQISAWLRPRLGL